MAQRQVLPVLVSVAAALALASCTAPSSPTESSASSSPAAEPVANLKPEMVYSASIPSMCEFPAGKLVNGQLQEDHPEYPNATAPGVASEDLVVAGDLTGDGLDELAAAFYCDMGGVAWPSHIQLFENDGAGIVPLGKPFQMHEVNGGARGFPSAMEIADGKLLVDDSALLPDEPSAMPTGKIKVALSWNGKALVPETIQDAASADGGVLDLRMINGSWCPGDGNTMAQSPQCIEIAYPRFTDGAGNLHQISFSVFNGATSLSYADVPMGMVFEPGQEIDDPANPHSPKSNRDRPRIYNSQTWEFYVKDSK